MRLVSESAALDTRIRLTSAVDRRRSCPKPGTDERVDQSVVVG